MLDLPNSPNICLTFYTSEVLSCMELYMTLCSSHKELVPIITEARKFEYCIDHILDA